MYFLTGLGRAGYGLGAVSPRAGRYNATSARRYAWSVTGYDVNSSSFATAVAAYQVQNGLTSDGMVGPKTLASFWPKTIRRLDAESGGCWGTLPFGANASVTMGSGASCDSNDWLARGAQPPSDGRRRDAGPSRPAPEPDTGPPPPPLPSAPPPGKGPWGTIAVILGASALGLGLWKAAKG